MKLEDIKKVQQALTPDKIRAVALDLKEIATDFKSLGDDFTVDALKMTAVNLYELAARSEQMLRVGKTSKYRYVCYDKANQKWRVVVTKFGDVKRLGRFKTEEEAKQIVDKYIKEVESGKE